MVRSISARLRTGLAVCAALLLSGGGAAAAISQPVATHTGLVSGTAGRDASISVFKGIPYAAPPVGDLRWKAPQPAAPWSGVRKADQFGALCPQSGPEARGSMSEDCLTLNIWTGANSGAERRPVFVWIYGGGFSGGSGSSPQFDGEGLARKGVVVVTFNYRLGALGFLATPELSRESGHNASGNYGLLDDIAVLKWVQQNIAAFGGDPGRVTIGGQSAGAGSVGFMVASPLAKGLFHRAIAQSHVRHPGDPELRYLSVSWRPLKSAEAAGSRYAQDRGARTLAELRALPWQKVIEGGDVPDMSVESKSSAKPPLFRPAVDGWVVPYSYSETFARRAHNRVTFIAGSNLDETGAVPETAFAKLRASTTPPRAGSPQVSVRLTDYLSAASRRFEGMLPQFLKLYPAANDQEAALQSNASARDNSRTSNFLWASLWRKAANTPVYTYYWTHAPPGPGREDRGAYHGSEINYVFNNLYATDRPWTDEDRRIADTMSSYWANFIATGDPNGPGLPRWAPFNPASTTMMEVGDRFGPIPVASKPKLAFWKRFFEAQTQW